MIETQIPNTYVNILQVYIYMYIYTYILYYIIKYIYFNLKLWDVFDYFRNIETKAHIKFSFIILFLNNNLTIKFLYRKK